MIAANPRNRNSLLGASITFSRADDSPACRTYASSDGGYTWSASALPEQYQFGGGDPQVAFSTRGTAIFTGLTDVTDKKHVTHSALLVYRSMDGGKSWGHPRDLGYSYDHEQIAVDSTTSRHRGRIYLGALYGKYPQYIVGLFRSDDDGRTFQGPLKAADGHGIGINVTSILVATDGTVIVPFVDFQIDEVKIRKEASSTSTMWLVRSNDGGSTYSRPYRIAQQHSGSFSAMMKRSHAGAFDDQAFPQFAIDGSDSQYSNRLYAVWPDRRSGVSRVMLAYSSDKGATWSNAKFLESNTPGWSSQLQPMIAVNRDGVVAITWFDTRESMSQDRYREYIAVSMDGGVNFSSPRAVSSSASFPRGVGNVRFTPFDIDSSATALGLRFGSAFQRWPNGGDYMGLAADVAGVFHPFWADARTGTFQLWTASVRLGNNSDTSVAKKQAVVTKMTTVIFEKSSYDPTTGVYSFPIRLKNISDKPIYGPLSVQVTSVVDPWDIKYKRVDPWNMPRISNASNGRNGSGAVFDYSHALGDFEALDPGAMTSAIVWKIKLRSFAARPYLGVAVTGYLPQQSSI